MTQYPEPGASSEGALYGASTRAVHAGLPDFEQGAPLLGGPVFAAPFHLQGAKDAHEFGYGRDANPTWSALESALGTLEGGTSLVFASGMAAVAAVLFTVLKPGDKLVAAGDGYPGVRFIATERLAPTGVEVQFVSTNTEEICAAADGARLVWIETPSNPKLDVCDIAAVSAAAHKAGALVAVDNTLATPLGQLPLALGADISMMSGTKTLSGHSDVLVGAVSTRDGELVEALKRWRSQSGSVIGAMEAWLVHRSLATLALRLERSSAGALAVAGALRERGIEVYHPSDHAEAAQMLQYGCLVGFVLESEARAQEVLARCELVAEATSFGGVHATAERRERWGTDDVPPGFIRYSAGIEDPEDLVVDLLAALGA